MTTARRVLITGAGGFVGSHVIPVLLEHGYDVIAVDRTFDAALKSDWGSRVAFLEADADKLLAFEVDALIHGAAVTASPEEAGQTPEANFRANLDPLLATLEWAERNRVRRAVFISSSAVFRESPPGAMSEDQPPTPHGLYAVAKHTMETLIGTLRDDYGRDVVTVRLSNVYGVNEHPRPTRPRVSLVGHMVDEALRAGKLTVYKDSPVRDWTFASDIGQAIVGLLQVPHLNHALYNVASGQVLTQREVAQAIQSQLPSVEVDVRDGSDPTLTSIRRGYLSSQRLRDEMGFSEWTPFAEGLRQVIEYRQRVEVAP